MNDVLSIFQNNLKDFAVKEDGSNKGAAQQIATRITALISPVFVAGAMLQRTLGIAHLSIDLVFSLVPFGTTDRCAKITRLAQEMLKLIGLTISLIALPIFGLLCGAKWTTEMMAGLHLIDVAKVKPTVSPLLDGAGEGEGKGKAEGEGEGKGKAEGEGEGDTKKNGEPPLSPASASSTSLDFTSPTSASSASATSASSASSASASSASSTSSTDTIYQTGFKEGEAKGFKEGLVQGKAEGFKEGLVQGKAEGEGKAEVKGTGEAEVKGTGEAEVKGTGEGEDGDNVPDAPNLDDDPPETSAPKKAPITKKSQAEDKAKGENRTPKAEDMELLRVQREENLEKIKLAQDTAIAFTPTKDSRTDELITHFNAFLTMKQIPTEHKSKLKAIVDTLITNYEILPTTTEPSNKIFQEIYDRILILDKGIKHTTLDDTTKTKFNSLIENLVTLTFKNDTILKTYIDSDPAKVNDKYKIFKLLDQLINNITDFKMKEKQRALYDKNKDLFVIKK